VIKEPKNTTIRVTEEFCIAGEPVPVDTVLLLETPFARELVAMNKAEVTDEAPRNPRKASDQPAKPKKSKE